MQLTRVKSRMLFGVRGQGDWQTRVKEEIKRTNGADPGPAVGLGCLGEPEGGLNQSLQPKNPMTQE